MLLWDQFISALRRPLDCAVWRSRMQSHLLYA
jgi:hypothetical protein